MQPDPEVYRKLSLENLFRNSPNALVSINADYGVADINQAFSDLFGYNLEEIRGKHIDDVMNMGKANTASQILTAKVLAGEHIDEEGIRYDKYGKPINVLIKGFPILIDSKMAGAYGIYIDITKRKQTEMVIQESEARNRAILSAIPDLMFIYSRDGVYLDYHAYDESLLAANPRDFLGKSVHEILPAEVAELTMQCFEQIYKTRKTALIEYTLELPDGPKNFEARITIMDEERLLTVVRDITERKLAEEEIRIQRQRLENIIEGADVGTWELDIQSGKTVYNENWAKMLGYTLDELQPVNNKTWEKLCHPDDLKKSDGIAERHLKGELPYYECECRMKHKDGHWIWVLDRGKILRRSAEGRPVSMFGTHTNITEQKMVEEHIRYISLHDDLTDLYNRTYLDEEMKRLDTTRQLPLSVIMADLNGLKLINDTYGHADGDRALKCAADIIRKSCREEDIIARWGGDEFVILLPQTTAEEALLLCKRIKNSCLDIFVEDVPVSMALGVATKVDATADLNDILREAENDMYKQKLTESRSAKSAVLRALLKALEAKSFETEAHTRGMQEIAQRIGEKLNLPDAELSRLDLLITLHDIGKINIAEEILVKEDPLTIDEWDAIKKHPEIGFRIARATEDFAHVAEDILAHHERWDGSGYPHGIAGKDIPLLARIAAIADAYEVMRNGRPYKEAMSPKAIAAEFKKCSGTHFDPNLVRIFLSISKQLRQAGLFPAPLKNSSK